MSKLAFGLLVVSSIGLISLRKARRALKKSIPLAQVPPLTIEADEYVQLLGLLVGQAEAIQNYPPEFVPEERKVVRHLLEVLRPYSRAQGGPLQVDVVSFAPGRENLIIRYESENPNAKTISFVGSHLDVVPADQNTWKRNPFELSVEGNELYGRGTTDCLGHVAMLTLLMRELAKCKPSMTNHVCCVFIAAEENNTIKGVGVDGLMKAGHLAPLKNGAMLWVDASDSQPCMGTAGAMPWKLTVTGKRGHSGFPQNTVNPIELAHNALTYIQSRFYKDFPPHSQESVYKFATPSTFKPTQFTSAAGSLNQIPPSVEVCGDIRLTPFYDVDDVTASVNKYVEDLNKDLSQVENIDELGPSSRFSNVPGVHPSVQLEWLSEDPKGFEGIACDIQSSSFDALVASITRIRGNAVPYSINGSLPLVRQMQREGFELQITGFGLSKTYHADNEYALLSDMLQGAQVCWSWMGSLDQML